jgi:adenylate kinase
VISFPRVIVIAGTPGVGKTAISKILVERLNAIYINITELIKRKNLILSVNTDSDANIADMDKLSDAINRIIDASTHDVIVDGHFATEVVSTSFVPEIFVLRLDPSILQRRLQARSYKKKKIVENVTAEILDVCLVEAIKKHGVERVDQIDITTMTAMEISDEIITVLDGHRKPRISGVDWLGTLEGNGRLDKFLNFMNLL